jgi:hypothetical protein
MPVVEGKHYPYTKAGKKAAKKAARKAGGARKTSGSHLQGLRAFGRRRNSHRTAKR